MQPTARLAPSTLALYLERVGLAALPPPTLAGLHLLHRCHTATFVFENLSPRLGEAVSIDCEAIADKFVRRSRGGYGFEHNTLFAALLRTAGFSVRVGEARVVMGRSIAPRPHIVLFVAIDGEEWLADVGFGEAGLTEPMRPDGTIVVQNGWHMRVVEHGHNLIFQTQRIGMVTRHDGGLTDEFNPWFDLYVILPNEVAENDIEVGNWYTSTHPASIFRRILMLQRTINGVRHSLRNLTYTRANGPDNQEIVNLAPQQAFDLITGLFGVQPPDPRRLMAHLHALSDNPRPAN